MQFRGTQKSELQGINLRSLQLFEKICRKKICILKKKFNIARKTFIYGFCVEEYFANQGQKRKNTKMSAVKISSLKVNDVKVHIFLSIYREGGVSIEIFEIFQTKYNFIMIHRLSKIYSYRQPFLVFLSSSPFLRALKMIKFRNGPSDTRVPDWTFHPCDLNKRFARIFVPPRI